MNLEHRMMESAVYIGRVDGRQRGIEENWERLKGALVNQPGQLQHVLQALAIWILIVLNVWA